MSLKAKEEVIKSIRYHYQRTAKRPERTALLTRLCEITGLERKYALKRLHGQRGPGLAKAAPKRPRGGSRPIYGLAERAVLKSLWLLSEQPCGKRLKSIIPLWLPSWQRRHGPLPEEVTGRLHQVSPAQIDRLLRPFKTQTSPKRPAIGSDIRSQIPLRVGPWEETGPGWFEADTVAHCGGCMGGSFAWSLVLTDIATQWTECRATWNRSDLVIHQRVQHIEKALPFPILGFDSDNGGEFVNRLLHGYFRNRDPKVLVTRSRPYHKNDNAHIEQKNSTHIRQFVGFERLEVMECLEPLNELLTHWSLWNNLFCPNLKLLKKVREGTKMKKIYEKTALTPAQRLLAHSQVPETTKEQIRAWLAEHDPIEMKAQIEAKHTALWSLILTVRKASNPAA